MGAIETSLCGKCGLCCDGSLFADVIVHEDELGAIEDSIAYEHDGTLARLHQPCMAHQNGTCTVYPDRPQGCQTFECAVLKAAKAGELDISAAIDEIETVKKRIEQIEKLVDSLSTPDPTLPLSDRCQAILQEPIDLEEPAEKQAQRESLFDQVTALEAVLENRFRT